MAERPRNSRWRRLPNVFRLGEHKLPDPDQEPERLTLYLPAGLLDAAEAQSLKQGDETIQQYCERILSEAIEAERVRDHVADIEARRGTLEGLNEIANDPEYLAEWTARFGGQETAQPPPAAPAENEPPIDVEFRTVPPAPPLTARLVDLGELPAPPDQPERNGPTERVALSRAAEIVLRHAGQGEPDPAAFLPTLRRGEPLAVSEIAELARALQVLENESRGAAVLDRRVAYALHRMAFESQVLHTDAWPGAFDDWTIDALRAVQEAVERIVSGQDIRFNTAPSSEPGT